MTTKIHVGNIGEIIEKQLTAMRTELASVAAEHDKMVIQHNERCQHVQKIAQDNLAKINQLQGAIGQFEKLLKSFDE